MSTSLQRSWVVVILTVFIIAGCSGGLAGSKPLTWTKSLDGEITALEYNPLGAGRIVYAFRHFPDPAFFRSDDYGQTWRQHSEGIQLFSGNTFFSVKQIFCLPSDTSVILIASDRGVYRKNGVSDRWTLVNTTDGVLGESISFHSSGSLYYGQYYRKSVWKSTNNGLSWSITGPKEEIIDLCAMAVSPINNKLLIAGSNNGGIARSVDCGAHWQNVMHNKQDPEFKLPPEVPKVLFYVWSPKTVFVTRWLATPGLLASTDEGKTWDGVGGDEFKRSWAFEVDQCAPKTNSASAFPQRMWIGQFETRTPDRAIYESLDFGKSWSALRVPAIDRVWTLRFDTMNHVLAAATSSGLFLINR